MMKRLIVALMGLCMSAVLQAEENDAIYVWVDGSSACYQLSKAPTVSYSGTYAVLSVDGKEELKLDLSDGKQLIVTYGEYDATGIDDAVVPDKVSRVGKYIRGGHLIIVKDGKQYDANGILIKN